MEREHTQARAELERQHGEKIQALRPAPAEHPMESHPAEHETHH
jgi:hypothetical protein